MGSVGGHEYLGKVYVRLWQKLGGTLVGMRGENRAVSDRMADASADRGQQPHGYDYRRAFGPNDSVKGDTINNEMTDILGVL